MNNEYMPRGVFVLIKLTGPQFASTLIYTSMGWLVVLLKLQLIFYLKSDDLKSDESDDVKGQLVKMLTSFAQSMNEYFECVLNIFVQLTETCLPT